MNDQQGNNEDAIQTGGSSNNSAGSEWGGQTVSGSLGKIVELKDKNVIVIGTLETGGTIDQSLSFRVTTFDANTKTQTQQAILMNKMFISQGIKVDDRVEIHGYRTEQGFIKAISIFNLDTHVKTGKLKSPRYGLLIVGLLILAIGIGISSKEHQGPFIALAGGLIMLLSFIFLKKVKFISEKA